KNHPHNRSSPAKDENSHPRQRRRIRLASSVAAPKAFVSRDLSEGRLRQSRFAGDTPAPTGSTTTILFHCCFALRGSPIARKGRRQWEITLGASPANFAGLTLERTKQYGCLESYANMP